LAKLRYAGINFSSVILINTNPKEAIERSRQSDVKSDWVRDNTQNEGTYSKICDGLQEYSERLTQSAIEHNIQYIDMSEDFAVKTEEVYKLLTEQD
jgi:hypothetical protein